MRILKRIILSTILLLIFSCKKNNETKKDNNRIIIKTIKNEKFKVIFYKISTISDITSFVSILDGEKEITIFHGNNDSVIDIYFGGKDTLLLECYKPSSTIIYDYKKEYNGLKILKDTLISEEEYIKKTH
ncbi:hypothetical protein [Flavobacterium sp. N2038]|uniref:hypothetical protein n=1 Tax=Flavobacterium sp. N2038 TaxID=2986829 RepID=UPI0022247D04|nr:hypothetical protein [Flavobacterium sp. N2038]